MQPITSGTTTERIVRALFLVVLVWGFAIAYLWDGFVRYPRQNATSLLASLGLPADSACPIDPTLTFKTGQELMQQLKPGTPRTSVPGLRHELPLAVGSDWFYVGPGGHLRLRFKNDAVEGVEWVPGVHSETDLAWQKWIGGVLCIFGTAALIRLLRVALGRVSVTPQGLLIRGKGLIPPDSIRSVQCGDLQRGDSVVVGYQRDGRDQTVTLDDYVVKDFHAVVAAICQIAGCSNPLQASRTNGKP